MKKLSIFQKRLIIVAVCLYYIISGIAQGYYAAFFEANAETFRYLNLILGAIAVGLLFSIKREENKEEESKEEEIKEEEIKEEEIKEEENDMGEDESDNPEEKSNDFH